MNYNTKNADITLKIGDTIQCLDADDAIYTMQELSRHCIETVFLYELNGQKGIWLKVTEIWRKSK